jgi:alpha-L-arabinofuranosidase
LKLKGRKLSGYNAFIIPFAVKDASKHLRAHIGSYVNRNVVFESVAGESVADVTNQKRLPHPIEPGRWYDIRLEVAADKVDCYLNDTLLHTYREPSKLVCIAGKDSTTGELIIKVVNGYEESYTVDIQLNDGFTPAGTGIAYTLQAPQPEAENSFVAPTAYIPVSSKMKGLKSNFTYTFQPLSITVLRLQPTTF